MTLSKLFKDQTLISRILFLIFGLVCFRVLAAVPIPQVNIDALRAILSDSYILGVLNLFSGGGLYNFSIVMLGVIPYITVAIIMQLLTTVSSRLHSLYHEEGVLGKRKFMQYVRVFSVPVIVLQSIGILSYFQSTGILPNLTAGEMAINVITITAGSVLLMWIGELISEFGIGNGISVLIFAGIVVTLPQLITNFTSTFDVSSIPTYVFFVVVVLIMVTIAVWMNEANRPIPITYARYGLGTSPTRRAETYLPLRVNPIGVLPIIFGIAITQFILFMSTFAGGSEIAPIQLVGQTIEAWLQNGFYFSIPVFFLTIFFTYFYAHIVLNTDKMAQNLQKGGAFVPGIRPGEETRAYIDRILKNVLFYSAIFLATITIIPFLITGSGGAFAFAIGGAGLIIAVHVVLNIYEKIRARLIHNE